MGEILSQNDIEKITGYRQPKRQCATLAQRRIPYTEDKNGRPVLTWTVINGALLRRSELKDENAGFNLGAL